MANVNGKPIQSPRRISPNAPRSTSRTTCRELAPNAMRTPISFVRRAALCEITPYSPIEASTRERTPKNEVRRAMSRCWVN